MANISNEQWQILLNILGAVETGGQVYGQRDYADYTEAYANSSIENSITLGAFAEFGSLAKGLVQEIKDKYPTVFAQYDNAGIAQDLQKSSWTGYSPSRTSAKARAIINIINSSEGRKVQDERFIEQMKEHVALGEKLGVTDVDSLFEICNISHQGGIGAVKRIIAKTSKPYTLDHIYQALCTDNIPNQVGTFTNRQRLVYQWLKQYMPKEQTTSTKTKQQVVYNINRGTSAEDIINIFRGWLGLSRINGSHKVIIDTYNSYLPHPRGYAVTYTDDYCATTVSAAFVKANAVNLIGGIECSVERIIEDCFKPNNIWIEDEKIVPVAGDIICFNWGNTSAQNTGWADHIGIVEYVEGNTIHTIEGNSSGGIVARRQYPIGYSEIRGYARPKYGSDASTTTTIEEVPDLDPEPILVVEEPSQAPEQPSTSAPQPTQQTVQPTPATTPTAPTEASMGTSGAPSKERKSYGVVVADVLNVRVWPGVEYAKLKSIPQIFEGQVVEVCDTLYDNDGDPWYYIRINNVYGFASAEYIQMR